MMYFSKRNGFSEQNKDPRVPTEILKGRIYAEFYRREYSIYETFQWDNYTTGIEDMMIAMGIPYQFPNTDKIKNQNADKLEMNVLGKTPWFLIYDFIEKYLSLKETEKASEISKCFNNILEEEGSVYRILDNRVVPITNEYELHEIEDAQQTPYEAVNTCIKKATERFSDRKKPDYENCIKESISAVESMCCIICNDDKATLGKAIKQLKNNGVHIHPSLEAAFSSLYGYTSDENGIRHGGIDFTGACQEDAKYMLITCSAFINYLIEKQRKSK